MHILSPETDNCLSWISGRERLTVENISWSNSTKECCRPRRGLNPRPPGLQSDGTSKWATEAGLDALIKYWVQFVEAILIDFDGKFWINVMIVYPKYSPRYSLHYTSIQQVHLFTISLQKQAYSNLFRILPPKTENLQMKNSGSFHISAQNIDCG